MSAIESVWSPDGVLVLMDMGSALLSTEMALELLSEEQRSAIYLLAAPVVEGAMSAVTSAAAGLSVTEIIAEVDLALCAKQQQLMPSPPARPRLFQQYHQSIIPVNGKLFAGRYVIPTAFMLVRQPAS